MLFRSVVDEILADVLTMFDGGRAYIIESDPEHRLYNCTYEVTAENVAGEQELVSGISMDEVPWWTQRIANGQPVIISSLDELPDEAFREREVLAMTVERDVEDCYKAEYMRRFEGEEFDGVISSVTQFGLYVELPNTVEGLVRAQALSENALTLTEGVALRDILSGREWRLGDVMRVRVAGVDVSQGNVDFVPAQEQ